MLPVNASGLRKLGSEPEGPAAGSKCVQTLESP